MIWRVPPRGCLAQRRELLAEYLQEACAPTAPSITRWSQDSVALMTVATACSPSLHDHFLLALAQRQDGAHGRIDDGGEIADTEHAEVGYGEGATGNVLLGEFPGFRLLGEYCGCGRGNITRGSLLSTPRMVAG